MAKQPPVKPQPDADGHFDLLQMVEYLRLKYRFEPNDLARSDNHFENWCRRKGYKSRDPEGKHRRSSQMWYAEYCEDPKGGPTRPARESIFEWIAKVVCKGDQNIKQFVLNIRYYLDLYDIVDAPAKQTEAERINAMYKAYTAMVVPPEMKKFLEKQLVPDAKLSQAVRKVLKHILEEFGPSPSLKRG
jgi:hypothetical protein